MVGSDLQTESAEAQTKRSSEDFIDARVRRPSLWSLVVWCEVLVKSQMDIPATASSMEQSPAIDQSVRTSRQALICRHADWLELHRPALTACDLWVDLAQDEDESRAIASLIDTPIQSIRHFYEGVWLTSRVIETTATHLLIDCSGRLVRIDTDDDYSIVAFVSE